MNVFVIPSWYPSPKNALNGIFIKEQVMSMSTLYNDIKFGISLWGQNDERFLLHAGKPLSTVGKLLRKHIPTTKRVSSNVSEYFSPSFSHTNKLNKGNIDHTVEANYDNFKKFKMEYGQVEVIHAHVCYKAGYIAQQLSQRTGVPYIITEHIGPFPQKHHTSADGSLLSAIDQAMSEADALIAVSSDLKNRIMALGIDRPIDVIPNFIESISITANNSRNDKFSFVTLSGMSQGKGIAELLSAIKLVVADDPEFHFTMVGDGPQLTEFKELSQRLNIESFVTWIGMVEKKNVSSYLSKADAHILVSHYESFGVAYIEAMAHGVPSIAAAIGGPKDIIDHDTGLLVEQVSPELIAAKIKELKQNYEKFDQQRIIDSFKLRFSTDAVAPEIRNLYRNLAKK